MLAVFDSCTFSHHITHVHRVVEQLFERLSSEVFVGAVGVDSCLRDDGVIVLIVFALKLCGDVFDQSASPFALRHIQSTRAIKGTRVRFAGADALNQLCADFGPTWSPINVRSVTA